jgi:hypothetical protein
MDNLVKEALARVEETVNAIPWDILERKKEGEYLPRYNSANTEMSINRAIHAVDALKSSLKTISY